jgi:exopolysaccharide biosynthesis protein
MEVSAHGPAGNVFYNIARVGDPVEIIQELKFYEAKPDISKIKHIMAGGPRLVKNGYLDINSEEEQIQKDVAQGRAARSAVGITADNQLLMVVVEGLSRTKENGNGADFSTGMSLEELAQLMFDLGAKDAVNFDGGGSSTLIVKDQLINHPVRGEEVRVGNALLVKKKKWFFWF